MTGKLGGAAATWYTDPLVWGMFLAIVNVILGLSIALLVPQRFFATNEWQSAARLLIGGSTLTGAAAGAVGLSLFPKRTITAFAIFDFIYLVVLILAGSFAYEFDVALLQLIRGKSNGRSDMELREQSLNSLQKATSLQDYISIIETKASQLFKHDSQFILATMCAAISSNVDQWVYKRCQDYTTPDFVKSALQASWTNNVGFKLFSLVRKAAVNNVIHSIQEYHSGNGHGFFITDLHICDKINYTKPLFVEIDPSNIEKVARLLWLLRYMHSVYGEGKGKVNNKWQPSQGDPNDIAASLLRCFNRGYSRDHADNVLHGRLPSDIIHTSDVINIAQYMSTFNTLELSDQEQKKKYTALLTDAFK
jgi:hypothetical protein